MYKAVLCLTLLLSPAAVSLAQNQSLTDAQVDQRVNALLQQMTVDEKIGQLSQEFVFDKTIPGQSTPEELQQKLAHGELGSLLFITDPEKINRWQHIAVEQSRLHKIGRASCRERVC